MDDRRSVEQTNRDSSRTLREINGLGRDYLNGLKAGLGDNASKMIVGEASYEISDPTIDSPLLKLKDAGADLLFSASTPKQAAQAIKKIAEMGWNDSHHRYQRHIGERGAEAGGPP